jgi:hypothetical protein
LCYPAYAQLRHSCLPCPGHIGARRSSYERCIGLPPTHQPALQSPSRVQRLSRSARCTGRVGRCSPRTHPCMSLPNPRSLEACLAAQRACLPQLPRHTLPWPQTRPLSPSQEPLALRSARLCDRARSAGRTGRGAWQSRLLESSRGYIRACQDRVSGGTLGCGHEGSVQPPSGALRARVASQESSGALE